MPADDEVLSSISRRYHHFADKEARGRSRLYEQCARAIATDPAILAFLATLPELPHVVWRAGIDLNPLDVTDADDVDWGLSNEAPGVLPELRNEPAPGADTDPFILARAGRTALALTDGHGTWIEWISS